MCLGFEPRTAGLLASRKYAELVRPPEVERFKLYISHLYFQLLRICPLLEKMVSFDRFLDLKNYKKVERDPIKKLRQNSTLPLGREFASFYLGNKYCFTIGRWNILCLFFSLRITYIKMLISKK